MAITVEMEPEEELRLREIAAARGVRVEEYVRAVLTGQSGSRGASGRGRAFGKYAHVPTSSEKFAERKQAEKAREARR